MNESFMSSFASLSESMGTLGTSAGELGLLVLYIYYLLVLLRNKGPAEIAVQVGSLLRDIEESMVDTSVKDRILTELQALLYVLQHGKSQQYRERLDNTLMALNRLVRVHAVVAPGGEESQPPH